MNNLPLTNANKFRILILKSFISKDPLIKNAFFPEKELTTTTTTNPSGTGLDMKDICDIYHYTKRYYSRQTLACLGKALAKECIGKLHTLMSENTRFGSLLKCIDPQNISVDLSEDEKYALLISTDFSDSDDDDDEKKKKKGESIYALFAMNICKDMFALQLEEFNTNLLNSVHTRQEHCVQYTESSNTKNGNDDDDDDDEVDVRTSTDQKLTEYCKSIVERENASSQVLGENKNSKQNETNGVGRTFFEEKSSNEFFDSFGQTSRSALHQFRIEDNQQQGLNGLGAAGAAGAAAAAAAAASTSITAVEPEHQLEEYSSSNNSTKQGGDEEGSREKEGVKDFWSLDNFNFIEDENAFEKNIINNDNEDDDEQEQQDNFIDLNWYDRGPTGQSSVPNKTVPAALFDQDGVLGGEGVGCNDEKEEEDQEEQEDNFDIPEAFYNETFDEDDGRFQTVEQEKILDIIQSRNGKRRREEPSSSLEASDEENEKAEADERIIGSITTTTGVGRKNKKTARRRKHHHEQSSSIKFRIN